MFSFATILDGGIEIPVRLSGVAGFVLDPHRRVPLDPRGK